MDDTRFHMMPDGRRIAYRFTPGAGPAPKPAIVFLPGYRSDMAGGKATALYDHAVAHGRACLLFDYAGCGLSGGDFADGTLTRWRDEALALIAAHLRDSPLVLVGSSMGGWLMLLVAAALPPTRLAALVGIAAAPDFTDWGFTPAQQAALAAGETVLEDNPYGPDPTPTHPGFWADAAHHRQFPGPIALDVPVRLIHGLDDGDVPPEIAHRLLAALRSADIHLTLVKGGDHRLSRPADIALLIATVAALAGP